MKNLIYAVALGFAIILAACGGGQPDNVKTADSANAAKTDSMANKRSVTDLTTAVAKKHGAAFDKAYVKMMVADHKEDIEEFRHAAMNANDPDIKALAATNIPILQKHLDSVQNLTMVVK